MKHPTYHYGIAVNKEQFIHQLFQVLLVGLTIGMTRTVIPALAESEFGVARGSFLLLVSFVVAFGVVKSILNFVAGWLSEKIGRQKVLILGWLFAFPIPFLIAFAPNWNWIVIATICLGVNQGLCWSMTQTAKLDITQPNERGMTLGFNEFAGYVGLAIAGVITGYLATVLGARIGLLVFGLVVISTGFLCSLIFVKDTLAWAKAMTVSTQPVFNQLPSTWEIFKRVSLTDKRLAAISQAGLVEKFVDALVWIIYPIFLFKAGLSLSQIGWVIGVYGVVWGISQLGTGRLSDKVGRHWLNISGMWICGAGVALMMLGNGITWWVSSAAVSGFGMALLYPNLSAAIADFTPAIWRGTAIGIYRFWRDLGYAIGALGLGLAAYLSGALNAAFWFVAIAMFISGFILLIFSEESHPSKIKDKM
ncbi:MFS transporter [Acinetobacter sp. ESBL14]|uniref:MFS transporter n=1 Tax=Acinetobacter sp. ESBL14 TaxID=3077329 RepID=UPI002FC8A106